MKRQVRVRCGFGCAICGATITEYEHFYPDFREASRHDPASIVLLCPNHHTEVTKGVIPKEAVASASHNPVAKSVGYSTRSLPWFQEKLTFKVGGIVTHGTPIPFCIRGDIPIRFAQPEVGSSVLSITANIRGPDGKQILMVEDNEWRVEGCNSDFEWIGNRYKFRCRTGEIVLQIRFDPPEALVIEKMLALVGGSIIDAGENFLRVDGIAMPMIKADYCGAALIIN